MSEFFRGKGFKVLAAVFVVLFGIVIGSLLRNGVAATIDGAVGLFVTPVRAVSSAIGSFFSDIGDGFKSKSDLLKKVEELEKENNELKNQLADYEKTKQENEQLRDLINLQEENEDMEFALASVISRSGDEWSNTVSLSKGSIDGIAVGDPVVTKDSFLVGYVSKTGATWCTVTTILDITSNVGARMSSSREVGVMECTAELSKQGKCRVSYLPRESSIPRGELVLTSGLGGYYPAGLIIGQTDSVYLSDDGLSSQVTVTPAADIDTLTDVFVITYFAGQGQGLPD